MGLGSFWADKAASLKGKTLLTGCMLKIESKSTCAFYLRTETTINN